MSPQHFATGALALTAPEPGSLALLLTALAGARIARRRRA